jgi:hypothetical protein
MKKRLVLIGIMFISGLFLMGCPAIIGEEENNSDTTGEESNTETNGEENNTDTKENENNETKLKLEGTWKHSMVELNAVYIFSDNNWSFTADVNSYNVSTGPFSGTYTLDDASITFTDTNGDSSSWTQPYMFRLMDNQEVLYLGIDTISGNFLTRLFGEFLKQ